jgi:transposase-like protein
MDMVDLTNPIYNDDDAARAHLEALYWPDGPICPHCGVIDQATKLEGKSTRPGVYKCRACRKPFSVTVGTVFERSKIAIHKWVHATHLMNASKKGVSSHQLHRMLGVTYQTAWFMSHRIREAMRDGDLAPLGGGGSIVEADETYYGKPEIEHVSPQRRGLPYKKARAKNTRPIVALVERGGNVRTFHVPVADQATVEKIVTQNIARESRLHTDESKLYFNAADHFTAHKTVKHTAKEYARDDVEIAKDGSITIETVHTNSAEGYFSIFKRGMRGVYQHCKEKHLHRYLAEFDFRYNNRTRLGVSDTERAEKALRGARGKRLMYRRPRSAELSL